MRQTLRANTWVSFFFFYFFSLLVITQFSPYFSLTITAQLTLPGVFTIPTKCIVEPRAGRGVRTVDALHLNQLEESIRANHTTPLVANICIPKGYAYNPDQTFLT